MKTICTVTCIQDGKADIYDNEDTEKDDENEDEKEGELEVSRAQYSVNQLRSLTITSSAG
jgi:hypothetical protein